MRHLIALLAAPMLFGSASVMAQPVDPEFSKGPGSHPIASVLLFPIYLGARIQASLQPEKDSCWNGDSSKVAFCGYADRADDVVDNRPTPYGF
mgnify:CR=1 FL=1